MKEVSTRIRFIRWAIPPVLVLWTLLMLMATLLPGSALPDAKLFSYDKVGHFAMFAGWTFFLGLYFIVYKEKTTINLYMLVIAGVLFGAIIEGLQFLLPGNRTASWGDILANTAGAVIAFLALYPIKEYFKRLF
ncbi:VanZ family protein [Balneolaceae bacterium ANBcel3]|nr:VanZ family protein [Balneolaceae bacterium ANBcel3]